MAGDAANPFLALALIPAEIAIIYEYMRYVYVAVLAAYTWDWLVSLSREFMMVKKDGFSFTIAIYFASRLTTQSFITAGTVSLIAPLSHCDRILLATSILSVFTCLTTTSLFFLRVRAIFHNHRWIIGTFALLWIAVNGASILVPFSTRVGNIPGTRQCITTYMHPRTGIYAILHIVNHILTFIGISWKLVTIQHEQPGGLKRMITGKGFSRLSRVLWSSGQLYFFTTIGLNILNIVFMLSPKLHPIYHFMLVPANVGLENAMACRIFRQLKFDTERQYIDTIIQDASGSALPYRNPSASNYGTNHRSVVSTDARKGSVPLVLMRGAPLQDDMQKHLENDDVALSMGGKPVEY